MRRICLLSGGAVLAAAWLGPLPALAADAFAAHMTLHMLVVAVAPPLLAAGVARTAADPVRRMPWLFAAVPASLFELIVVWAWHVPPAHMAARHEPAMFAFEQATFFAAGVWLWLSIVGGDPRSRPSRAGAGVIALILTFAHMTLLGALLSLSPRQLYVHETSADALGDLGGQQLGGSIMLVASAIVYLGAGLWLSRGLLSRHHDERAGAR